MPAHPDLKRFIDGGSLDVAFFDAEQSEVLELEISGQIIGPGAIPEPVIVIANYLLDSIRQDVYRFGDGKILQVEPVLSATPPLPGSSGPWGGQAFHWLHVDQDEAPFLAPRLRPLFDYYRSRLEGSYVVVPTVALDCLQRMQALSLGGLLLLAADKGAHALEAVTSSKPPPVIRHGAISLPVNFNALSWACKAAGGLALLPAAPAEHLTLACLVTDDGGEGYPALRLAFHQLVETFGPDEVYTLSLQLRQRIGEMQADELLQLLKLNLYDPRILADILQRLVKLSVEIRAEQRLTILAAVRASWSCYFWIGEAHDLASQIAGLLYTLDLFDDALAFYEISITRYGLDTGSAFNMAACRYMLGDAAGAAVLVRIALAYDPGNLEFQALLARCEAERTGLP